MPSVLQGPRNGLAGGIRADEQAGAFAKHERAIARASSSFSGVLSLDSHGCGTERARRRRIGHVHDDGSGVNASDLTRGFERFRRGPHSSRAAGSGPATVRRLVEHHGGGARRAGGLAGRSIR